MRILRSQYIKLQNNADDQLLYLNNNGFEKTISNPEEEHDKEARGIGAASMILRRRGSTNCFNAKDTNIKILIQNFDESLKKLNVIVEFTQMNALWLTQVYKTYENDLWHKKPRLNVFGNKKWYFYCRLCDKVYMRFLSMKTHLNQHLHLYPYICKLCPKQYTNRKSATNHLTKIHKLSADQWNEFLTS